MASDAQRNNYLFQIEIVTHNAEGTTSGNGQSEATQSNDVNIVQGLTHNAEGTTSGNDQSEATQSNDFNIVRGLLSVVFVCIVCGAHYFALTMADRVSVALAPVPPVVIVHALYMAIHAIEKYDFAKEWVDDVTNLVETVGLVGNFFKPRPIFFPSAQALLGNAARVYCHNTAQPDPVILSPVGLS